MGNPPAAIHKWRAAGLDRLERRVERFRRANQPAAVEVEVRIVSLCRRRASRMPSAANWSTASTGDGEMVTIQHSVDAPASLPFLPRVGMELVLPPGLKRSPGTGAARMKTMRPQARALVGRYSSTVDEQFTPYVYPSESGGKEDTRWLALTGPDGAGCWWPGWRPSTLTRCITPFKTWKPPVTRMS
jgi:beta-galactosidase